MAKKDLKPVKLSKEYTKTKDNSQKLKKYLLEKKQSAPKNI